eukprot:1389685-Pleurochrysis_carterae.AAC.1
MKVSTTGAAQIDRAAEGIGLRSTSIGWSETALNDSQNISSSGHESSTRLSFYSNLRVKLAQAFGGRKGPDCGRAKALGWRNRRGKDRKTETWGGERSEEEEKQKARMFSYKKGERANKLCVSSKNRSDGDEPESQ